jgi:hypothetical protein
MIRIPSRHWVWRPPLSLFRSWKIINSSNINSNINISISNNITSIMSIKAIAITQRSTRTRIAIKIRVNMSTDERNENKDEWKITLSYTRCERIIYPPTYLANTQQHMQIMCCIPKKGSLKMQVTESYQHF